MSYVNSSLPIQQFVTNYGNTDRTYEVIDFVRDLSAANSKVKLDPNSFLFAGGKKRQVKLNYFPMLCDVEGDCDTQNLCTTGTVVEPKQVFFDIDRCISSKVYAINKDDIRQIDYNTWDFNGVAMEIIMHTLPDLRRAMAIEWETLLYSMAGIHPNGSYEERITVTDPATGIINPMGRVRMDRIYNDAGFDRPYVLGGGEVYNWKAMRAIGGLNAGGFYTNQTDTTNVYYDNGLGDQILGGLNGHIVTIDPQVFKYVYYLENAGIFRTDMASIEDLSKLYRNVTGGYLEGVIIDPVTGIPWDLYVRYNECDGQWNFHFKHRYNFFQMPDITCTRQGVNGIMRWTTCPEVIANCPTGTTPSPAIAPTVRSWTPGSIFPLYVATSNIGGYENEPNTNVTNIAELAALMNDAYGQSIFSVSGSTIRYTGTTNITGNLNGNTTITFA